MSESALSNVPEDPDHVETLEEFRKTGVFEWVLVGNGVPPERFCIYQDQNVLYGLDVLGRSDLADGSWAIQAGLRFAVRIDLFLETEDVS